MSTPDYRATPIFTNKLPPGLAFIIGNEAAERFSFYGMRAILIVFMTQYLLNADGTMAMMSEDEAKGCLSQRYISRPCLGQGNRIKICLAIDLNIGHISGAE